jgi:hypothetical protein
MLLHIFVSIFFAALAAIIQLNFVYWYSEGMILHWYYKLLLKIESYPIAKPLGLCPYCQVVWLGIGLAFLAPVPWLFSLSIPFLATFFWILLEKHLKI